MAGSFNPTSADLKGTRGLSKEKKAVKAKEGKTETKNTKVVKKVIAEMGEYNGNPTLHLFREGSQWGITFGVEKAKMIVEQIKAIEKFISQNDK